MKKGVFIVLDNTLIIDLDDRINVNLIKNWRFNLEVLNCITYYDSLDYHINIISNQYLIAKGILDEKVFLKKIEYVSKEIENLLGLRKNTIYYSYSIDKESYSYLPKAGMIYEIALEHELDLKNSIVIGTYNQDKEIADNAGINTYLDSRKIRLDT